MMHKLIRTTYDLHSGKVLEMISVADSAWGLSQELSEDFHKKSFPGCIETKSFIDLTQAGKRFVGIGEKYGVVWSITNE